MPPKKFGPPGSVTAPTPVARANNMRGNDDNRRDNQDNRRDNQDNRRDNQDNRRPDRGADNRRDNWESDRGRPDNRTEKRGRSDNWGQDRGQSDRGRFNRSNDGDENRSRPNDRNRDTNFGRKDDRQDRPRTQDGGNRNFTRQQSGGQGGKPRDDEDWGPKPVQQPEEPKPSFAFKPKTAVAPPEEPKTEPKVACTAASPARPAAAAVPAPKPAQPLVPKNCVVDLLPANDTFILTADSKAEDCDSGSGWVCVTLHPDQSENYERLLEPFGVACEASEPVKPKPGETFAYLDPADGAWYRARCLSASPARAALLDAARVVTLAAANGCRRLPADYADIPEFSAHLESDIVQSKDQVQCCVVSRSGAVVSVSLVNADTMAALGAGTLRRWSPRIHHPAPASALAPAPASASAQPAAGAASGPSEPPQVSRPPVTDKSSVLLADATAPERVFVRPADRAKQAEFDELVYAVALYGKDNATKLKELPMQGEVVLALFTDYVHYRALVQRVSSKHRRCLLEYIEYGNVAIVEDLETLYACPAQFSLSARPTLTSHVTLQTQHDFCPPAAAYLERLKDNLTELTLTIPSGEKTGPSKTPVQLTVTQSKESVNRMVESLSMPEWKRLLERGGDVLETETFYFKDITYVDIPASGGEMEIRDCSLLDRAGLVSGHLKDAEHARRAFALTPRIQEYCNSALAKDPYLPKAEELCIAMCPYRDENRSRPNDRNRDTNFGRKDDRQDRPRTQDGGNRNFTRQQSGGQGGKPRDDEDWGPKPVQQPEEPKPSFAFKPKTAVAPPEEPKTEPKVACTAASPARPAAAAVPAPKPAQPLVPKNCVVDLLPANDTFILTADSKAEDCDSGSGWVCVTLHPDQSENYERLLEPFGVACEASEPVKPKPGETFAYLDPADGAWYRARCLSASPARAALLDAARVVTLAAANGCRRLPADYADIPEFSAHLESDIVQSKDQVQCCVVSRSGAVVSVSLVNADTMAALGAGTLRRWSPRIHHPAPASALAPAPASASAQPAAGAASGPSEPPQVSRPPVTDKSSVLLADATAPERVFVRPADRAKQAEFDELVYAVALYGKDNATKLKELPMQGEVVLALFTDYVHYRALVQRVSSKHRRCLLEYIEYGNVAIVEDLETLYACPAQFSLSARPTLTSHVTLQTQHDFCPPAAAYLERLKDNLTELTLTIPSGEKTGPSKTPVQLTVTQSKESVNRMVESLSMPEWKRLLERGGDVLETETFYFKDITYVDIPASGGEMEIRDCSLLDRAGLVSGHLKDAEHARRAFALTPRIQEYCNSALAKDPYLPKAEELCIAMCPYRKQWLRGVLLQQEGGPGGAEAQVLFYDYGHIPVLPVSQLRKIMPEFAREPAAVCTLEIKDFPKQLLAGQLERALAHMRYSEHGPGVLAVTRVTRAAEPGEYLVEAPDLLRALRD